jgi:hypothetical protein
LHVQAFLQRTPRNELALIYHCMNQKEFGSCADVEKTRLRMYYIFPLRHGDSDQAGSEVIVGHARSTPQNFKIAMTFQSCELAMDSTIFVSTCPLIA